MASITITIPDDKVAAVLDAFAARYGRLEEVEDLPDNPGTTIPNPETKAQFAKRMVAEHIKDVYVRRKEDEANVIKRASVATAKSEISGVE